ncbi:hypothetical protein NIE88_05090 [Sporolactobacillus shoreicorticis]|uniref:DnaD domain-containing protein n=1 Tax=Sporolactobacillus shoreicorticis TaxID=1923877 RepID=A0ABW5S0G4_9BACL|nr:hypothetical protein [Sporolactobacillus shoreicorticis]MCO7125148.1 hypothetical protein [Sporolactobacillus shoreicorticis]
MAKFRQIHVNFWSDPKVIEEMTPEDRYFYLYLLTNPLTAQIGVYQITKKQMAFDLGYSLETVNSLINRFEMHHRLIKYNLNKTGKSVLDCIDKELASVKDKSLLTLIVEHIPNDTIVERFLRVVNDTCNDTSTTGGQEEEKEEEQEKEKTSCRKTKFSDEHLGMANLLLSLIQANNPNYKAPEKLDKWANDIRLMMERDKRTKEQVEYLIRWSQKDDFWSTVILSPNSLRKGFDKMVARCRQESKQKQGRGFPTNRAQQNDAAIERWLRQNESIASGPSG